METKYRRVVKETVWDGSAFVQKEFFIIKDRIEVGMWLEQHYQREFGGTWWTTHDGFAVNPKIYLHFALSN